MKTLKENLKIIIAILSVLGISYPLAVNFKNPEITQMQLFLDYWWLYLICLTAMIWSIKDNDNFIV